MENTDNEIYEETINWLAGYVDGITENDFVQKSQLNKMIDKLAKKLELKYPLGPEEDLNEEEHDDLPF